MPFETPEGELKYKEEYEKNLRLWPVKYETFFVPTSYGSTHVIAAGEEGLLEIVLLKI